MTYQGASLAVCDQVPVVSDDGWIKPVSAPVVSGFGPRSGGFHYGTDLGASRNTVIRAASAGRVIYSGCDPGTGNCDIDGAVYVSGCGWYVEVLHANNVATRYCHMIRRPEVRSTKSYRSVTSLDWWHLGQLLRSTLALRGAYQRVVPVQQMFAHQSNAVDPEPFMRAVGAPLS